MNQSSLIHFLIIIPDKWIGRLRYIESANLAITTLQASHLPLFISSYEQT